jgi:hypothetical protein
MNRQKITKTNQTAEQGKSQSTVHSALPAMATAEHMLYLQRTIGNQTILRLIQTKLKSNQTSDQYEQEADRVAEEVTHRREVSGSYLSGLSPAIQRQEREPTARTETLSPGLIVEDEVVDVNRGGHRENVPTYRKEQFSALIRPRVSYPSLRRPLFPSAMFQNVLDVLRNEKPVYIYFAQGRGFLSTSKEPVGEGELKGGRRHGLQSVYDRELCASV